MKMMRLELSGYDEFLVVLPFRIARKLLTIMRMKLLA